MKKSISVSNLTLSLYLDYVRPAAIRAGLLEAAVTEDGKPYHITDEAIAREIESCMRSACFNAGYDGVERTHEEYTAHEAEEMLYQFEVSLKYCKDEKVLDAVRSLRDEMVAEIERAKAGKSEPAMKLNKDTKQFVEIGDTLAFESDSYLVTNVIEGVRGCRNFTIQDKKTKQVIYACPSSQLYGCEIQKGAKS